MAWLGSSYNLWNDEALTSAFSGTLTAVNKTNLSDNPQNFTLFLGSPTSSRILQDSINPGVDDIVITPIDNLPEWIASTAYIVGDRVQPTGGGNGFVYKCTTAGTSDASEPSWSVAGIGSTTVDNSIIWELISAHHPSTEVILAIAEVDLDTNTPGASLAIGHTVDSLSVNAVPIYIRLINTVTNTSNNIGHAEIALQRSAVIETAVP